MLDAPSSAKPQPAKKAPDLTGVGIVINAVLSFNINKSMSPLEMQSIAEKAIRDSLGTSAYWNRNRIDKMLQMLDVASNVMKKGANLTVNTAQQELKLLGLHCETRLLSAVVKSVKKWHQRTSLQSTQFTGRSAERRNEPKAEDPRPVNYYLTTNRAFEISETLIRHTRWIIILLATSSTLMAFGMGFITARLFAIQHVP